jgi:hypothetical protein
MRFPIADPQEQVPWWSRPFGVRPGRSWVEIEGDRLTARFGPWTTSTPLANVTGVRTTGPYSWWKVVGPARGSLADGSLTFATRTDVGVEITFATPVRGLDPWGRARHPSLTVTVADPDAFVGALRAAAGVTG